MEVYYVKVSNVLFCWMSSLIEGSTDDFYRTKGLKSTDFRNFILLVPQKSSVESSINVDIHQKKASKVLIVELEAPFLVNLWSLVLMTSMVSWRRSYEDGNLFVCCCIKFKMSTPSTTLFCFHSKLTYISWCRITK